MSVKWLKGGKIVNCEMTLVMTNFDCMKICVICCCGTLRKSSEYIDDSQRTQKPNSEKFLKFLLKSWIIVDISAVSALWLPPDSWPPPRLLS